MNAVAGPGPGDAPGPPPPEVTAGVCRVAAWKSAPDPDDAGPDEDAAGRQQGAGDEFPLEAVVVHEPGDEGSRPL